MVIIHKSAILLMIWLLLGIGAYAVFITLPMHLGFYIAGTVNLVMAGLFASAIVVWPNDHLDGGL